MNRQQRREAERFARRPHRAHHDESAMRIPLAFGATNQMQYLLALRDRQAIDAVISGQGAHEDMQACVTIAVTAAHACQIASETPALAALILGIEDVRQWLRSDCMDALVGIYMRHQQTGRVGVAGTERAALLQLADIADQIRGVMPRRVLHQAFERALRVSSLRAALGLEGQA